MPARQFCDSAISCNNWNMRYSEKDVEKIRNWLGAGSVNLFGRPFSGKDTQSKHLSRLFKAPIIGGGDIIRGSATNEEMQKTIDKGNLAPQKDYLNLVIPFLSHEEYIGKPLILNSLGRWHGEESPILNATHVTRHPIKAVIYLDISEADVWKRWENAKKIGDRGVRNDDNDTSIKNRLKEFKNKTLPVIEHYQKYHLVVRVDGTATEDTVLQSIVNGLLQKTVTD